jgi:signal transduction histidine kinase
MALIGKMTSMVGHDLRNPLQVVRLIGSKMEKDYREEPRVFDMIRRINKNVVYMDKIVSDLQLLAKDRIPQCSVMNLGMVVSDALSLLSVPEGVEVECRVSRDYLVRVDATMFTRVFCNLFNNAFQAMSDGGRVFVDCVREDGFDVISVQDTGEGIEGEILDKMFTPFYTTKAKGMGLGLSVCKKVVESHGGEISVESSTGEGTVFYLKIPSVKDGVSGLVEDVTEINVPIQST